MRRILLLITDLEIGGTPTVVRELALRLRRFACIHVACLGSFGPIAEQISSAGIDVTALGACCAADMRILARLRRLHISHRFDTVFSFLIHANAMAAALSLARGARGVRFIQSIQTTQPQPAWHWSLQRLVQAAADRIVVPTESVAEVAMRRCGVPQRKIIVIPNAIDPGDWDRTHDSTETWPEGKDVQIGFVGRLDPVKRVPDLVQAVSLLRHPAHLHIFGDGPARHQIEQEISRLGIRDKVSLHGRIPDPRQAMRQIDILVLPSQAEGFGLVLIEAMAAGIPVVASNAPGIRDVIRPEQTGLLVPIGSPRSLAGAIARLIDDPQLRSRLTEKGRSDVATRFSWNVVLPQYQRLMDF